MFYNVTVAAMAILAIWAAFWAGFSATRYNSKDKTSKAFWRMSLYWGVINLGIAAFGLVQAQTRKNEFIQSGSVQGQQVTIVGVNVFLDVMYILLAAILIKSAHKKTPQRLGYGRAILVQGLFLLMFDIILVMALDTVRI